MITCYAKRAWHEYCDAICHPSWPLRHVEVLGNPEFVHPGRAYQAVPWERPSLHIVNAKLASQKDQRTANLSGGHAHFYVGLE